MLFFFHVLLSVFFLPCWTLLFHQGFRESCFRWNVSFELWIHAHFSTCLWLHKRFDLVFVRVMSGTWRFLSLTICFVCQLRFHIQGMHEQQVPWSSIFTSVLVWCLLLCVRALESMHDKMSHQALKVSAWAPRGRVGILGRTLDNRGDQLGSLEVSLPDPTKKGADPASFFFSHLFPWFSKGYKGGN